ncbi:hypothetical protein [Pseudomonas viridiflava]|uniref:hypothetical protein n=1 Tax=Pseudomonas viridiflava TaxID=33069 RepID=UPI000F01EC27|nr:hypothetical protein [Pseudomonas viridiflava]
MSTSTESKPLKIKPSELFYTDYSDQAVPGDDPTKTKEDSGRFSRKEKYEVVDMINSISWKDNKNSLNGLLTIEWMIHEELPSNVQGREKVKTWIYAEYKKLLPGRPARLKG